MDEINIMISLINGKCVHTTMPFRENVSHACKNARVHACTTRRADGAH
ncbi:MAG: hypothetical protein ACTSU9_17910 [Promethearchaeota archaeon]